MLDFLRRWAHEPGEQKRSRTAPLIAWHDGGRARWTPRDYAALAREGYQKNPIAHRCVRLIAEAAAQLPFTLTRLPRLDEGRGEVPVELEAHPALDLIRQPNARQGGIAFLETLYSHLCVAGNAYVEGVAADGTLRELHALRPDRVSVVPGPDGWPQAWDYTVGGRSVRISDDGQGFTPILHLSLFHPLDDHYGLSPLEAAAQSLDIHNGASVWNKALLDNAARPAGALVYAGGDGSALTDQQFERLKAELEDSFQGVRNAGRPLLLEGGLDWKPLSLTPKDMDFIAAKAAAARDIALAFGVPPLMLGLPGDATHANYAEAQRAFWRQTIIPLTRRTGQSLANWLSSAFGDTLMLEPDLDAIEALADDRESLWKRVSAADFLTEGEKREALGYSARKPDEASR